MSLWYDKIFVKGFLSMFVCDVYCSCIIKGSGEERIDIIGSVDVL